MTPLRAKEIQAEAKRRGWKLDGGASLTALVGANYVDRLTALARQYGQTPTAMIRIFARHGVREMENGAVLDYDAVTPADSTHSPASGMACTVTPNAAGGSEVEFDFQKDSAIYKALNAAARKAGMTLKEYIVVMLERRVTESAQALDLPADVAATFREIAAVLGRDPQSWTTGFLRSMAADLADVGSGLLRDEVDACGADPAVMRRFRAYCKKRTGQTTDERRAQRPAA